ncbi:MAG: NAD(P)/FAD-dependent oxidoreductase [Dehalococcoidia bacterium]
MYDAIVVGARVAGAPTAMLLARRGHRVLMVDRAIFPSDTMSTHYIHQPGVAALRRWGLLHRIKASGCPSITTATMDLGSFALTGWGPAVDGVLEAIAPRRTVLDQILVGAAREAGAEVREEFTIDEILSKDGVVTGIRGHDAAGRHVIERARIVIGADGMRSSVAAAVGAPTYHTKPALTCPYYSYWSGVHTTGVELYVRPGRAMVAIPTNDGLTCVVAQRRAAEFPRFRADIEGTFMETLAEAPDLLARVRAGRREARWIGTADLPNFFRKPYGPGWALVGDAGYHKDPITGYGITDAFRDAEFLAEAVDTGLAGRLPMPDALAGYEARRNEVAMPLYEFITDLARLDPSEEQQHLLAALQGNPAQINRMWGVIDGTVPIADFFASDNITRIMSDAQAA